MERFKICPSCGARNAPNRIECDQCEADITAVPVNTEAAETKTESAVKFVRICDCGAKNAPQARRCTVCGEDISDIVATEDKDIEELETSGRGQLVSVNGAYSFTLPESDITIGRSHCMSEYLGGFSYVSRSQAKITWRENIPILTNLSRTNPTYINNKPLSNGQEAELKDGDEIGLGGCVIGDKRQDQAAYFIVQLCL